jgi:hypothetical protein
MDRVAKLESLQEIIAEMAEGDGTGQNPGLDCQNTASENGN